MHLLTVGLGNSKEHGPRRPGQPQARTGELSQKPPQPGLVAPGSQGQGRGVRPCRTALGISRDHSAWGGPKPMCLCSCPQHTTGPAFGWKLSGLVTPEGLGRPKPCPSGGSTGLTRHHLIPALLAVWGPGLTVTVHRPAPGTDFRGWDLKMATIGKRGPFCVTAGTLGNQGCWAGVSSLKPQPMRMVLVPMNIFIMK